MITMMVLITTVQNINKSTEETSETKDSSQEEKEEIKNSGKLILDATCTPTDIHYPSDLWL